MFRTATACAVAALFCAPAMAQTVTAGQYNGVTQYTALVDPEGLCASQAGLAAGQTSSSVATVKGLGLAWTTSIANTNPTPGVAGLSTGWINCKFAAMPAATDFTAATVGTATEYTDSPTATQVTSCFASNGTAYTLTSTNSTLANGLAQTNAMTILPVQGDNSSFKITTSNTALAVAPYGTICYLSTDALYSRGS
jgi:hypothetical protein